MNIALTFDDGPNTTTTKEVLDRLEKYGVRATFFLIGNQINDETIPIIKRQMKLGCEINNHSFTHSFMDEMEEDVIREEIRITSEKIKEITGEEPRFFRPPYIKVNDLMYEIIDMPFICGLHAEDWNQEIPAAERAKRILEQAQDGVIFLLHDLLDNDATVEALDTIIPELLRRGYTFLTVSELFAVQNVPVKKYPGRLFSIVE